NHEDLSFQAEAEFPELPAQDLKTGAAWALKENFDRLWGYTSMEYFYGLVGENTLERVLAFAGADDPARALKLVSEIAEKQQGHHNLMPLHHMVGQVLSGWVEKDAPAAIRWAAASGTDQVRNELWRGLPGKVEVSGELIAMLDQATETECGLIRRVLQPAVETAVKTGNAAALLARLPLRDADEITGQLPASPALGGTGVSGRPPAGCPARHR
ncbi:MAG: hypothetical protein JWM59_331, partial [Verrucomicrobiales bacterium]|nr:hypothetical protein [Verrucomicrobiales bacterium]